MADLEYLVAEAVLQVHVVLFSLVDKSHTPERTVSLIASCLPKQIDVSLDDKLHGTPSALQLHYHAESEPNAAE
jgi:hypothetical protein